MAALCQPQPQPQPQRVSIAETYAHLVGRGACRGSSMPTDCQDAQAQPTSARATGHQPPVSTRASVAKTPLRESTPVLQSTIKHAGTPRPFDPAGVQTARQQRRASMAASIERARRVARAKWEAERPSILAELKQNRPSGIAERRRQTSRQECSSIKPEPVDGFWKPPPTAAPTAGADRARDEELSQLRMQMQQMKQYVSAMEAMIGHQLVSQAVAGPEVSETARPQDEVTKLSSPPKIPLAPVSEDSVAEAESPSSDVDLDTQLLFETFETAKNACAEVSEAEAEHGNMLDRVSPSPLAKDRVRDQPSAAPRSCVSTARSPLATLTVDPNNVSTDTQQSVSRLQVTKKPELNAACRGSSGAELTARMAISPNPPVADGGSPEAHVTYTEYSEYSEYEEYVDSTDGSPAAPGGVQICAAVVDAADKVATGESETRVMRGRLSF